jgi:DNA-directed RNA polymerase subunit beta'
MKHNSFDYIQLTLASPEDILRWSRGEVKKPETINYRTYRAEPEGLMCEKIFGPMKDYECYCGKYKKYKYKGIICDKCGVEVTRKSVRRERMGHIRLAAPVTHIWYAYGIPNKVSIILDIPQKKLQSVIYFSRYIVVESDDDSKAAAIESIEEKIKEALAKVDDDILEQIKAEESQLEESINQFKATNKNVDDFEIETLSHKSRQKIARIKEEGLKTKNEVEAEHMALVELVNRIKVGETLTEEENVLLQENEISFFSIKMGAEAIQYLLQKLDLEELVAHLRKEITSPSLQKRLKAMQRLKFVNSFLKTGAQPDWLVLEVVPVISPELRPIVAISGGRFATADLNDLYRRVINRNNRLKRLIELGAPEVILRNEKRMLQEAVDALMDNEHRPTPAVVNKRRVPFKSLSASLRGKQGRFRQNLLGKRVDYSGRAVIVTAGRDLNLNQCGVPKNMALELFKPFVINQLIERGLAANARSAKYMIEGRDKTEEVWNVLDEVIQGHPVLLNRAPTLQKQGVQAFFPVLVEGDSIRLHPMVCEGFNADFDGDQMAIHVPLTKEAIDEAIDLMMPEKNMLKATSGEFIMAPSRDLIQSLYYLTTIRDESKEVTQVFSSIEEAEKSYQSGTTDLKEKVKILMQDEVVETTVGRILFNEILPSDYIFVNEIVNKKKLQATTLDIFKRYPIEEVSRILNKFADVGFRYSTSSGFSVGMDDLVSIPDLDERVAEAMRKTQEINEFYKIGLLTPQDKADQFAKLWLMDFTPEIQKLTTENLSADNSTRAIAESGSRFGYDILNQIIGVKGVIQNANNQLVELPIGSNYLKGFSSFEYFISAGGARKGLADTALRTADSGYLTRKLCEVSQDSIIRESDCGQNTGVFVTTDDDKTRSLSYEKRLYGRTVIEDVKDKKGNVIVSTGELISEDQAKAISEASIKQVEVRTPLTCKARYGVCQKCYGVDYSTNRMVDIGRAIGILAAQSIGEPATQLVLRTFYKAGAAGEDITTGMPRIQELFEARIPKRPAIISEIGGTVEVIEGEKENVVRVKNIINDTIDYPYTEDDKVVVKPKQKMVKAGDLLFTTAAGVEVRSSRKGNLIVKESSILVESNITEEVEYKVSKEEEVFVSDGDVITAGTTITRGNIDPRQLLQARGITDAQKYIIDEIQKVYQIQGIALGDKHVEVIVAQMGRYVRIVDAGDSDFIPSEVKDKYLIHEINAKLEQDGKKVIKYAPQLLGITAAALRTESFLSAASFQEQVRVLSEAAIMGKKDHLIGLKENVIIGRMIPVGENAIIENNITE